MSEIAISLKNVSKCFKRYAHPVDRLKELLFPGKSRADEFWALRDINLVVPKGQTLGIVGRNGSGKSTLLQIIAGTLTPMTGEVRVKGRVSALLELGSGFNPEFTGRQNVFFNGRLLGLSQREIEEKFDEIAAFADIGDFIDQPVKTYSSGMFVRLAFAVAISVDPEVLIVDEALSVGDGVFVHRCMAKIKDFQDKGGTILFVSHDVGSINRLCSCCVWIDSGRIVEQGEPLDVSKSYQAFLYERINEQLKSESDKSEELQNNPRNIEVPPDSKVNSEIKSEKPLNRNPFTRKDYRAFSNSRRFGTGRSEIISLEILNTESQKIAFVMPDETLIIRGKIMTHDRVDSPIFGITMFDRLRVAIAGWNTTQYGYKLPPLEKGTILTVIFTIKWPHLKNDTYALEPAIADGSQESNEMMDWIQTPISLESGVIDLTFGFMRFTDILISHDINSFVINPLLSGVPSK